MLGTAPSLIIGPVYTVPHLRRGYTPLIETTARARNPLVVRATWEMESQRIMLTDSALAAAARMLRTDRERGAMQLAARAVAMLPRLLTDDPTRDIRATVRALATARPSMVAIANAVALCAAPVVRGEVARAAIEAHANESIERWERANAALYRHALSHIPETLLTYSNASTTRYVLITHAKHLRHVVVPEGRPIDDGKRLAIALAGAGIPVTVITEAQFGAWVPRVGAVIVGADTVGPDGAAYNHMGTATLALLAATHGVPMRALTHTLKIAPHNRPEDVTEENDPAEVWSNPPPGITIRNPAFDRTPPEHITIITEHGVLTDTLRREVVATHGTAWRDCGLD